VSLFDVRGVVLLPEDLTLTDWPRLAADAGLNTIALHVLNGPPSRAVEFLGSPAGERFLRETDELGLSVEYELHALMELLPRELFEETPELFRMDETERRTADHNLCCSSKEALRIAGENAVTLARKLTPTTHRYFLWSDDGGSWCHCSQCEELSPSDQSLLITNALLGAVRRFDPKATMAALAYYNTLEPPTSVKPAPGVFLEFAPIGRSHAHALSDPTHEANRNHAERIDALIETIGAEGAQVLEYWMDASRASGWKRPAKRLPLDLAVLEADLSFYARRGFSCVTSFACFLDAEYAKLHGLPPIEQYGRGTRGAR